MSQNISYDDVDFTHKTLVLRVFAKCEIFHFHTAWISPIDELALRAISLPVGMLALENITGRAQLQQFRHNIISLLNESTF